MDFPFLINLTSPCPFLGLLGGSFHFYSNFNRIFCKQTVETLIRRRILRRLIRGCTVCLCLTRRMLRLYWLNMIVQLSSRASGIFLKYKPTPAYIIYVCEKQGLSHLCNCRGLSEIPDSHALPYLTRLLLNLLNKLRKSDKCISKRV